MVQAQLLLLPNDTTWHLDPATRRIGRQGLAQARAALAAARTTEAEVAATASTPVHEHPVAA